MPHLIEPLRNCTISEAITTLLEAHTFLVQRYSCAENTIPVDVPDWGIRMKRLRVNLDTETRPTIVGKMEERRGELVNILATLERLIAALKWFARHADFGKLRVWECHPSTSDAPDSNDIVLVDENGTVCVRCEVCDISTAGQDGNRNELGNIKRLGCKDGVPTDGARRFICTSSQLAQTIQGRRRPWNIKHYRYAGEQIGELCETWICELVNPPSPAPLD